MANTSTQDQQEQPQQAAAPHQFRNESDLLSWAVLNTATKEEDGVRTRTQEEQEAFEKHVKENPIDAKWVDVILGKGDAVRMKESVQDITDTSKPIEERLAAFDELELLVESLDNANDLKPLQLWSPIISLLASDPSSEIRSFAAWVLGTAVQNNDRAQSDFLEVQGLPVLIKALEEDPDANVQMKCVTCLSGVLRHSLKALEALEALSSASTTSFLAPVLRFVESTDSKYTQHRRRATFLLKGLVASGGDAQAAVTKVVQDAEKFGWPERVVDKVTEEANKPAHEADIDFLETALSLLSELVQAKSSSISLTARNKCRSLTSILTSKYIEVKLPLIDSEIYSQFKSLFA